MGTDQTYDKEHLKMLLESNKKLSEINENMDIIGSVIIYWKTRCELAEKCLKKPDYSNMVAKDVEDYFNHLNDYNKFIKENKQP